jgi:signal transduction histidine kinase
MNSRRALLEASFVALLWLALLFALADDDATNFTRSAVSVANTLGAVVLTVRARPLARWREFGLLGLHVIGMMSALSIACFLFSVPTSAFGLYLPITIVGTLVEAGAGRLLRRFWYGWNKLRRGNIVWSLTHAHLMAVEGTLFGVLLGLMLLQILVFWRPSESGNLTLIEYIVSLDPYITIGVGITFLILGLVLPPSALFSYLVSRRLVSRILTLEKVTAQVEQGDYDVQVVVEGEDEISRLQARYNAMTLTLRDTIQKLQIEQATVAGLSKLQRDTIANISHDLRTPLATLQIYLDTLPTDPKNELIKKEIEHLRRLTDDLFLAAQNETLALTLRLAPIAIKPLLETIVEVTNVTAKQQRQVEIFLDVPAGLPLLLLDEDRFSQVVRNLLQNALRWTPPGGMILVKAAPEEAHVNLDIQDTGVGIASNELSNIWRRAYQVDPTMEGSGLGLTMVKNLVEAMQGSISVTSIVHSGTCFHIEFPI